MSAKNIVQSIDKVIAAYRSKCETNGKDYFIEGLEDGEFKVVYYIDRDLYILYFGMYYIDTITAEEVDDYIEKMAYWCF